MRPTSHSVDLNILKSIKFLAAQLIVLNGDVHDQTMLYTQVAQGTFVPSKLKGRIVLRCAFNCGFTYYVPSNILKQI
jgi:hypothetical protein